MYARVTMWALGAKMEFKNCEADGPTIFRALEV